MSGDRLSEHDRTSSSLLDLARQNDGDAWTRIVKLYTPLIYKWCRQNGLQAADIDTIGQEVFSAVATSLQDFRHDEESHTFRGWLRVITNNRIRNHFHQAARCEKAMGGTDGLMFFAGVQFDNSHNPSEEIEREELRLLYHSAVSIIRQEFRDRDWEAFYRIVGRDEPPQVVASDLGVSVNVIYLAKSRILKRLKEQFAGLLDDKPLPAL